MSTLHDTSTPPRSSLPKSWWIGIPIVAFWLAMTGMLWSREFGVERLAAGDHAQTQNLSPTESRLGVFLAEGQRIGIINVRQEPELRDGEAGARMTIEARMRLRLLGKRTDLDVSGSVWQPLAEARAEFDFSVRSAGFDFAITGGVEAGELRAEMTSAGEVIPLNIPVDEGLIFSSGLGSALRFPRLTVGDEFLLDSFDPITLSKSQTRVRCIARETLRLGAEEVSTCRLRVTTGGLGSLAWVDDSGEVVRAETPIGLVLERLPAASEPEPPEVPPDDGAAAGLLGATAIRPAGKKPFRSARAMTVRLGGLENLALPEDRIQTSLGEGVYRLSVPAEPAPEGWQVAPAAEDAKRYLEADAFVQSGHPAIRRQAAAIVGDQQDPWRRALAIHDWVFTQLDKEPVISIPSALEVLEQRRGDCNEHTVLFSALARAAGVPTRIAIGIVWSDELEGFYYHAWPEVHLGDWVWMDPTLGQPLADATHLKLLTGGIETWPQLLPYLGQLEIEVLAAD